MITFEATFWTFAHLRALSAAHPSWSILIWSWVFFFPNTKNATQVILATQLRADWSTTKTPDRIRCQWQICPCCRCWQSLCSKNYVCSSSSDRVLLEWTSYANQGRFGHDSTDFSPIAGPVWRRMGRSTPTGSQHHPSILFRTLRLEIYIQLPQNMINCVKHTLLNEPFNSWRLTCNKSW